jgi:hypothetical protein
MQLVSSTICSSSIIIFHCADLGFDANHNDCGTNHLFVSSNCGTISQLMTTRDTLLTLLVIVWLKMFCQHSDLANNGDCSVAAYRAALNGHCSA